MAQPAATALDNRDVLRTVTFYMALAMVFIKFGMLQEIQTYVMHFRGYLLYIVGVPALLGVLLSGGIRRGLVGRPAKLWCGFAAWMCVCVPFSSWGSGSLLLTKNYVLFHFSILFVIAGLVLSWRDCQLVVKAIGIAAIINIMTARIFSSAAANGRIELEFGMVQNSNDLAAHLLLTLPFLLLLAYTAKWFVVRIGALAILGYGLLVVFNTGSRGALVALIAGGLFVFFRGSNRQRIALACIVPLTLMAVLAFVPATVIQRIRSFSASGADVSQEAIESSEARTYLLTKSLEYSIHFPIFGVGPGQFINYEGQHSRVFATHGLYHAPHNSYLQAFAEMGLPGGILLLMAYGSTFLLFNRTYRQAKSRPDCRDIQNTTFCIILGMLGFCVAITFLNFTYFFYGPALAGLAISVSRAANYEFERRKALAAKPA